MGITEVLTVIFIVLKLLGTIDWSWWLVLLPEIIGVGIYLLILIGTIITWIKANNKLNREFKKF